jgi:hypothetical protein
MIVGLTDRLVQSELGFSSDQRNDRGRDSRQGGLDRGSKRTAPWRDGPVVRAGVCPSTLGPFLREFRFGHVRQLDSAARQVLVELAATTTLVAGTAGFTYVDVDSLLRRVYGHVKQGAGFGHTKVRGCPVLLRGLSPLIATISTDIAAPVVTATRLRSGNTGSARGADSLVAEALTTARAVRAVGAAP